MSDEKMPLREASEVPALSTEKEVQDFWDTHEVTEDYPKSAGPVAEEDLPLTRPRKSRLRWGGR